MLPDTMNRLLSNLQISEGYRKYPYRDTEGKLTIGIGMNLDSGEFSKIQVQSYIKNGISLADALAWTRNKIIQLDQLLSLKPVYNTLSEVRKAVLVDMCYNMGIDKLFDPIKGFKAMLNALLNKNWALAAKEMLNSRWARQVKGRAKKLVFMMENDQWA